MTTTGVTIMQMDAGLDTGPELLRCEIAVDARETAGSLHDKLGPLGASAIVDAVAGWAAGTLKAQPAAGWQGATYAAKLTQGRGAHRLVAPRPRNRPPGPRVQSLASRRNTPRRASRCASGTRNRWQPRTAARTDPVRYAPGAVVATDAGRLLVATGDGVLELLRLQLPGRKPLPAKDFLNARSLAGARFGDAP